MPTYSKWLTFSITLFAMAFFSHFALSNFGKIPELQWNATSIGIALLCIALIIANIMMGSIIWHMLLRDNEVQVSVRQTQIIFLISQFAKYLPGNVAQHIGRVLMAREIGIPIHITLNTMVIEMLWGISIATGLAVVSLLIFGESYSLDLPWQFNVFELCLGFLLLFFMPWIGIKIINTKLPNLAERLTGSKKIASPKPITAIWVILLFLICFLILGLILKLQALWFFHVDEGHVFQFTLLFSIAWLAGYLVPGAPGGLGVRETMMVLLLSPVIGPGAAVGLGITLRITTTIGDALAFLTGQILSKTAAIQPD